MALIYSNNFCLSLGTTAVSLPLESGNQVRDAVKIARFSKGAFLQDGPGSYCATFCEGDLLLSLRSVAVVYKLRRRVHIALSIYCRFATIGRVWSKSVVYAQPTRLTAAIL